MRKIILSVAFAATVAGAAAFAWQQNAPAPLSAVELENIEALSDGESGNKGFPCFPFYTELPQGDLGYAILFHTCDDCKIKWLISGTDATYCLW